MAISPTPLRCRRVSSARRAKTTPATKDRTIDKLLRNTKKADSFSSFPKLPAELRLKIWNLSLPKPRLVSIQCGGNISISSSPNATNNSLSTPSTLSMTGCTSSAPTPANLHICTESRSEALKSYHPFFGFARSPGHVFFNPEVDILSFGPRVGYMAADAQFHTCMTLCDPAELASVRRLAISDALFWVGDRYFSMAAASLTVEVLRQLATRMPGLCELIIVPREEDEKSVDNGATARERLTRQIQTAMQTTTQLYPSWNPPPWRIVSLSALPFPAS